MVVDIMLNTITICIRILILKIVDTFINVILEETTDHVIYYDSYR